MDPQDAHVPSEDDVIILEQILEETEPDALHSLSLEGLQRKARLDYLVGTVARLENYGTLKSNPHEWIYVFRTAPETRATLVHADVQGCHTHGFAESIDDFVQTRLPEVLDYIDQPPVITLMNLKTCYLVELTPRGKDVNIKGLGQYMKDAA